MACMDTLQHNFLVKGFPCGIRSLGQQRVSVLTTGLSHGPGNVVPLTPCFMSKMSQLGTLKSEVARAKESEDFAYFVRFARKIPPFLSSSIY